MIKFIYREIKRSETMIEIMSLENEYEPHFLGELGFNGMGKCVFEDGSIFTGKFSNGFPITGSLRYLDGTVRMIDVREESEDEEDSK